MPSRRILLCVPFREGGPRRWGAEMARELQPEATVRLVNSWRTLPRLLGRAPDVVHATLPFVHTRRPLLVTVKGDFLREARRYRGGYQRLVRRADRVTVPSEFLRERLGLPDAHVVPNAVRDRGVAWRPRQAGPLRVLVASAFAFPEKTRGTVELVAALAEWARRHPGLLEVDVAGGGPLSGRVEGAVAAAGLGFRFLGWVPDLHAAFASHDVVAYRSHLDNQPNLLIEAMMAGMPVLANPVGDVPRMVPPESLLEGLGDLPEALARLSDPGKRRRASEASRRRALERFTWGRVKPQWLALYADLAP